MSIIGRSGSSGATSHLLSIVATALVAAVIAVPLAAAPAEAGWASETSIEGVAHTRPALAMDADGHLGVAWQVASSSPGIMFATDATGPWVTTRVSDGDDWSPDVAFGPTGAAHVAYMRFGSGGGLYYATNSTGPWATTRLRADGEPWSPTIAVDGAGKLHVAYASSGFTPGIHYYTNASGQWAGSRVTTSTWDSEPAIAVDGTGTIRIAFARYEPASPGIFVRSKAAGSSTWSESRASSGPTIDDYPSLGIDPAGHLHIAFLRYDDDWNGSLWYATNATGSWVRTSLPVPDAVDPGVPSLGIDGAGMPEVVAGVFGVDAVDTLYRFSGPGLAAAEPLIAPGERASNFPDILRDAAGRLTVAYRNSWYEPGLYVHREDPDTTTSIADAVYLDAPVFKGVGDRRYLVVDRYATGSTDGTVLAESNAGAWSDTTIDPGAHGAPDLAVVGSVSGTAVYATNPHRLLWNEGAGWQDRDFAHQGDEASLALGWNPSSGAVPHVAYATDAGIRMLEGDTESVLTGNGDDWNPDLAVDPYRVDAPQVLAFMRGTELYAMGTTGDRAIEVVSDAGWTVTDADPAIGPDLSLPGPAQLVCLSDGSPVGCPPEAVRYNFPGTAWNIDLSSIPGAAWIWAPGIDGTTAPADLDTYTFTRTVNVPGTPVAGTIRLAADDAFSVTVNGNPAGSATNFWALHSFDIGPFLVTGSNTIVVTASNAVGCGFACPYSQNPGGVVIGASITYHASGAPGPGSRSQWTEPQLVDGTSGWDPAVAISEHSGTFIAYDHHATNPGIYVARGSTGSATWTPTRLSRSWTDSEPAITTGPPTSGDPTVEDSVYVAWVRGCSGPAPGIYLARNGPAWSWSVTQVVASCDVGDVSIDLVGGKVVLAYREGSSVVTATSDTSGATAGTTPGSPAKTGRLTAHAARWAESVAADTLSGFRDQLAGPGDTPGAPARRAGGGGLVPATP